MKNVYCLFFLTILLVSFVSSAKSDTKVFAGITPGVQFIADNKEQGDTVKVMRYLLAQANISSELLMTNWAQAFKRFEETPQSLIFAIARNSWRESQFQWVLPLAVTDLRVARSKYQPHLKPRSFNDLKNYKFAVIRGEMTEEILLNQGFVRDVDYGTVVTADLLVKYMKTGFVEFIFYESTVSPIVLDMLNLPPDYLVPVDVEVPENDLIWLAASRDFPSDKLQHIRATHRRLLAEPEYQNWLKQILPLSRPDRDKLPDLILNF